MAVEARVAAVRHLPERSRRVVDLLVEPRAAVEGQAGAEEAGAEAEVMRLLNLFHVSRTTQLMAFRLASPILADWPRASGTCPIS